MESVSEEIEKRRKKTGRANNKQSPNKRKHTEREKKDGSEIWK